ncbi:hypothetical protein Patl1_11539 [Pistacia atlantica]|uniref:Uncharacterized protein n=1 Tax=Pistacia atlantica TaxID=434234 RepID=A0ACC1A9P6_9ROSI|nr:hypothetical protein Patl1_11539 [Pistacia atlantica]
MVSLLQYYALSGYHHLVLVCLLVFRCWRVQWPKKDELCCFNDANEFYCIWLCRLFYAFAVWLLFCTFSRQSAYVLTASFGLWPWVLKFLGQDALKEVIENAELYQLQVPDRAMQCT